MPPGSNIWYHATLTIHKTGGTWQSSSSTNETTLRALYNGADSIPDSAKQPGFDGTNTRYYFHSNRLCRPSDAVWAEIVAAGLTPQPVPAGHTWIGPAADTSEAGAYYLS